MENRIWRATVEPTSTNLPVPGNSNQAGNLYTKTSLAADSSLRNLNREILSASQAYNNTPKPFTRHHDEAPATTSSSLGATYTISPVARSDLQQVKFVQEEPNQNQTGADMQSQGKTVSQEENMAPKLVHKQYNSPIDLYSMNNIRKTIEAHTELIAPGIKGINFMKPETPVNKQSEVYKLVKEEEEQRRNRQKTSRLSPISGQPVNLMSPMRAQSRSAACAENCAGRQHQQEASNLVHIQSQSNVQSNKFATQIAGQSSSAATERRQPAEGQLRPACCECGQFIVGPFAKIQNRFVHPSCFNCATCGTSLKNTGYFTINEKLYCEIHAKQVARVMQIKFDFEPGAQDQRPNQASATRPVQPQSVSSQLMSSRQSCSSSNNNSNAVTISTMFANRANSETRQESAGWSCGASSDKPVDGTSSMNLLCSPNIRKQTASSSLQHQESSLRCPPTPIPHFAQQQSMSVSMDGRGRNLLQDDSSLVGARTPTCVHCQTRIQGPYILAGKTTWCKACSQNNFQCSSCYRSLLDTGFIEDSSHKYYCEQCFEVYYALICAKCNIKIKGDCLNALGKQWHPSCFVCGHCRRPFGNSSFYLEDSVPYCERDWNVLFTTKCFACSSPIEAGDKWIEALNRNYHSNCFRCTSCHANLEGSTFYCKNGKPYCRLHAR